MIEEHGIVNEWMEMDVPWVFAAGDIRANAARQAVSAAGDGPPQRSGRANT